MNRQPTFIEGVAVAGVASLCGSAVFTALTSVLSASAALHVVIAGLALAYVIYLLRRSRERVGRITTLALWGLASLALWVMAMPLAFYLLAHIAMIWLIRSLYLYSSLFPALADLGLNALALAAALATALHSESILLSIWSFFLVQALFAAIPSHLRTKCGNAHAPEHDDDRFQHAHRIAESALRKLSSVR
ncbi:MAG: hypothetical protein JSW10_04010 [Pseudomonadota bacterium]|nr:MAG: hypothetical protein JSW10_04010 [Pseudomonadota bacterium]